MGWAGPFTLPDGRLGGYAVSATCDEPGCNEKIDRGLGYICGEMHGGDEWSCGKYFCAKHLFYGPPNQMCGSCLDNYYREHPDSLEEDV